MKQVIMLSLLMTILTQASISQVCESGSASAILDINNVSTMVLNNGELWWDKTDARYEFPKGSGEQLLFTGGLQVLAYDINDNLRMAGVLYSTIRGSDFYPGPINNTDPSNYNACQNWDQIWSINREDVVAHLEDFNDDGQIDVERKTILGWPGRNNPSFEGVNGFELPVNQELAPFVDLDGDGDYEPLDGEYPAIEGDQNLWWIMNDVSGPHFYSRASQIGMEVSVMAYASSSSNPQIDNTTYYEYTLKYKGDLPLSRLYFGHRIDMGTLCPDVEMIGFDEAYRMAYYYNRDTLNRIDTVCSLAQNEESQIHNTIFGIAMINSSPTAIPLVYATYYDFKGIINDAYFMATQGLWSDGTPFTYGQSGYNLGSTDTVRIVFPDDPSDSLGWSMCTSSDVSFTSSQAITVFGPQRLNANETITATYAVVAIEDVELPCPPLGLLRDAVDVVSAYQGSVNVSEKKIEGEALMLYPNPSEDRITIRAPRRISKVTVLDMMGKTVVTVDNVDSSEHTLSIQDLSQGVYYIEASLDNQESLSQKFIKGL